MIAAARGQLRRPDGGALGFARYGDPSGRPLLYFHGWPGSARQGALADEAAKTLGWQLVALDRPGLGESAPQPGRNLLDWPPLVEAALDQLGWDRCHLLAVSGGAPYAHACAFALPQRLRGIGICCGAVPFAELEDLHDLFPVFRLLLALHRRCPAASAPLLRLAQTYLELLGDERAMRPWRWLLPRPDRVALGNPAALRKITVSVREAYRQGPYGIVEDGDVLRRPWGFAWRETTVPLRLWHGAQDRTIPLRMARWLAREHRACPPLEIFRDEGHYSLPLCQTAAMLQKLAR